MKTQKLIGKIIHKTKDAVITEKGNYKYGRFTGRRYFYRDSNITIVPFEKGKQVERIHIIEMFQSN